MNTMRKKSKPLNKEQIIEKRMRIAGYFDRNPSEYLHEICKNIGLKKQNLQVNRENPHYIRKCYERAKKDLERVKGELDEANKRNSIKDKTIDVLKLQLKVLKQSKFKAPATASKVTARTQTQTPSFKDMAVGKSIIHRVGR